MLFQCDNNPYYYEVNKICRVETESMGSQLWQFKTAVISLHTAVFIIMQ